MNVQREEIEQRLGFIDRTIDHALRACHLDDKVPEELKDYVHQLGQCSTQAQRRIHPSDDTNYDVKSAVILAHIELSALQYRMD